MLDSQTNAGGISESTQKLQKTIKTQQAPNKLHKMSKEQLKKELEKHEKLEKKHKDKEKKYRDLRKQHQEARKQLQEKMLKENQQANNTSSVPSLKKPPKKLHQSRKNNWTKNWRNTRN